jgi:hypothetical protein
MMNERTILSAIILSGMVADESRAVSDPGTGIQARARLVKAALDLTDELVSQERGPSPPAVAVAANGPKRINLDD